MLDDGLDSDYMNSILSKKCGCLNISKSFLCPFARRFFNKFVCYSGFLWRKIFSGFNIMQLIYGKRFLKW